jgi:RecJ-like exonuclease
MSDRPMTVADARKLIAAGPLKFGDPEQIAAVDLIARADAVKGETVECEQCNGDGECLHCGAECTECEGQGDVYLDAAEVEGMTLEDIQKWEKCIAEAA